MKTGANMRSQWRKELRQIITRRNRLLREDWRLCQAFDRQETNLRRGLAKIRTGMVKQDARLIKRAEILEGRLAS